MDFSWWVVTYIVVSYVLPAVMVLITVAIVAVLVTVVVRRRSTEETGWRSRATVVIDARVRRNM